MDSDGTDNTFYKCFSVNLQYIFFILVTLILLCTILFITFAHTHYNIHVNDFLFDLIASRAYRDLLYTPIINVYSPCRYYTMKKNKINKATCALLLNLICILVLVVVCGIKIWDQLKKKNTNTLLWKKKIQRTLGLLSDKNL